MKKQKKKKADIAESLIKLFEQFPNKKKKVNLAELLKDNAFYNRNQSEEEYQKEQQEWIENVKKKKPTDE